MLLTLPKRIKLIIVLLISLLTIGGIVYFLVFKKPAEKPPAGMPAEEKTMEEILQSLTAPSGGEKSEVSKEIIKSLTAPGKGGEISEEILQSLTAPK